MGETRVASVGEEVVAEEEEEVEVEEEEEEVEVEATEELDEAAARPWSL